MSDATKKVTVNLPAELLDRAMARTGKGITQTLGGRGRCVVPIPAVMNRAVALPSTSAVCQTPGPLYAA